MNEEKLKVNTLWSASSAIGNAVAIGLIIWLGSSVLTGNQNMAVVQATLERISHDTMPRAEIELQLSEIRRDLQRVDIERQRTDTEHQKTDAYIVELRARVSELERKK